MTYKEKFVVVIKNKGKILRDENGVVRIPFGSEYSIYMKNLNSRKAVVSVSVDGDDTLDGSQIVLPAGESLDLKGFMKGTTVKNRFRFINKTKEIADYRGDRIDDGVVRVKFTFEREIVISPYVWPKATYTFTQQNWDNAGTGGSIGGNGNHTLYTANCCYSSSRSDGVHTKSSTPKSDEGITVKGSETNQQFQYAYVGELEPSSEVIVLRLKGATSLGKKVKRPITTRTKVTCPTCGRRWKSVMKYCGNCSTYIG